MRKIIHTPVSDLMSAPVLTVNPDTTIDELKRLFAEHEYNGLPVVGNLGILQGMVTKLDLFKLELVPAFIPSLASPWAPSVASIMSPSVITVYPDEPAIRAMALMVDYRIRTIPVVTDTVAGRTVAGVITRRDLVAVLRP
jgi:CBS domain-containing protein